MIPVFPLPGDYVHGLRIDAANLRAQTVFLSEDFGLEGKSPPPPKACLKVTVGTEIRALLTSTQMFAEFSSRMTHIGTAMV